MPAAKPSSHKPLVVLKFGGTSMGDTQRIQHVAKLIQSRVAHERLVVVVSAMSGETDKLLQLARTIAGDAYHAEIDRVLGCGETISAGLLALALSQLHQPSISLDARDVGIQASGPAGEARIQTIHTQRLTQLIDASIVPVITGFQGVDADGRILTLGRGGSDTSAVAVAAALGCACDIYTDVDGVYSADPRRVAAAKRLAEVDGDIVLELASVGAKVLHPRCVALALRHDVPLRVLSTFKEGPGTMIRKRSVKVNKNSAVQRTVRGKNVAKRVRTAVAVATDQALEAAQLSGVAHADNIAKITLVRVADRPGVAHQIMQQLLSVGVVPDMILQNTSVDHSATDISFLVPRARLHEASSVLSKNIQKLAFERLEKDASVALVSLVGRGVKSDPQLMLKAFSVLANARINAQAICSTDIRLSILVSSHQCDRALKALHAAFFE